MRRRYTVALTALIVGSLVVEEAQAQYRRYRRPLSGRHLAGASINVGVPSGEFEGFVDASPGVSAYFVGSFDRQGVFGLRLDAELLIYGSETVRVPLSPTIPRIDVEVETSNEIFSFFIGPQLTAPSGRFRPYLHAGVGVSWFGTVSRVRGTSAFSGDFASTVNFDDLTPAFMSGGGLLVGISRKVGLSLSGQYIHNGRVRYLTEGGIEEQPNGNLLLFPIESNANVFLVQFGVAFSFS